MPDLTKVSGVAEASIEKLDDVPWDDVALINGQTKPTQVAKRWMAGSRLGHVFTTTASNGDSGWHDGAGTFRGTGWVADIGDGQVNSIG